MHVHDSWQNCQFEIEVTVLDMLNLPEKFKTGQWGNEHSFPAHHILLFHQLCFHMCSSVILEYLFLYSNGRCFDFKNGLMGKGQRH